MSQSREIVVGVSGGIAAYKSAALVSQLVQAGHGVTVVLTAAAQEFIGAATFRALSGRPVASDSFDAVHYPLGPHIELARGHDLLVIAPATANVLAKCAHGIADDLLSTLVLSFTGPRLLAPAMNCEMWDKPVVQRNLAQCRADGFDVVDPEAGWLSCRVQGVGRMAEPAMIVAAATAILDRKP